ncbi:MAG: futalosine hydrolase [Phycisphaerales bacterium]
MSTALRILVVVAVEAEQQALGAACLQSPHVKVVVGGIGRTNAACAVAEQLARETFGAVVSTGIAGALPGSNLALGDRVVATECVYAEEGVMTPSGFQDMAAMRFPLGDFPGNRVPVDARLASVFAHLGRAAPIATVATCSGTDALAQAIALRTGAVAEAMEGAAVVHAARRQRVPAIEVRAISNTTGDRAAQVWDIARGLAALQAVGAAVVAATQMHQ